MADFNDVSPTSLKHLIGQQNVVRAVEVALDFAFNENTAFPSAMLLGPPGVGKSALAQVIANEMASDCQEVLGQSLKNVADVHALLLAATDKSVCHIDEAHEITKHLQTTLYLALDKRMIFINSGGRAPQPIPIARFSMLLSTTDEFKLLPPLRDRMRLVLRLSPARITGADLYRPITLAFNHPSIGDLANSGVMWLSFSVLWKNNVAVRTRADNDNIAVKTGDLAGR